MEWQGPKTEAHWIPTFTYNPSAQNGTRNMEVQLGFGGVEYRELA